ncbi:PRD domain-containing protein [Streptococcus oricebi]|uniref:Transcription antiterminator lact n=1 Tax=Streptococcus oricebi TaxID=1547447 RepID=A0ABS5B5T5_9STRE|nr:PRD domain-containing protein [Streptococcus oricebi]MBP2623329.1 transcription antiterminator lact [Streptococcus oricebi]
MLRIVQALNNNVALVKNEQGEQAVIMGLGLAFGKKKGDLVNENRVEQHFILKSEESKENFITLFKDVPLDFITASYEMIDKAIKKYNYPVQDYIYITLTYHIFYAYKSLKKSDYKHGKLPNIAQDYPLEYEMAKDSVDQLEKALTIRFPDEEIDRFALHFINAKGGEVLDTQDSVNLEKEIISKVQEVLFDYGIQRNSRNSDFYERFMVHMTYLIDRKEQPVNQNEQAILDLTKSLKISHQKAYEIASDIYQILQSYLKTNLSESEKIYLTLHIQRLL